MHPTDRVTGLVTAQDNFVSSSASYLPKPFTETAATLEPAQLMLQDIYRYAAA